MASQRFILLVNNIIVRDDQTNPIFEIQENGRKYYSNGKGENDLEDRVKEVVDSILASEQDNDLYELISQTNTLTRYNQDFKLKMFITPLYELQLQLVKNPNAMRIAGSSIDVQAIWQDQLYGFYVMEFLKYSQIIEYLETMVRIRRPKDSPFTIRNGENRVMSILHIHVNGLFNPLDTVSGLGDTKLFKQIYGKQEKPAGFSLDDPAIFQVEIMRGSITCYFATSSDILKLCGVDYKDLLTSRNLYRLIAAICMKNLFPGSSKGSLYESVLSFPVSKTLYQMVDPNDGIVVRYFEDPAAAATYAQDEGYTLKVLDTDANYIMSAFPKFRGKAVTPETNLLHQIRGAEFVY